MLTHTTYMNLVAVLVVAAAVVVVVVVAVVVVTLRVDLLPHSRRSRRHRDADIAGRC